MKETDASEFTRHGSRVTPTIAGFPTRIIPVHLGPLTVHLLTVKRLEDYIDAESLLRDADAAEPPYWAHLWPASRALAQAVGEPIDCSGKRVVEAGCGLGLVGIVAALRGAKVTLFDRDAAAVAFAAANAELNHCRVEVLRSDLAAPAIKGRFDCVYAADITYDAPLQTALADFAARSLTGGGHLLCAESVRTFDRGLQNACAAHGMHVHERQLSEWDEGRRLNVRLTEAVR